MDDTDLVPLPDILLVLSLLLTIAMADDCPSANDLINSPKIGKLGPQREIPPRGGVIDRNTKYILHDLGSPVYWTVTRMAHDRFSQVQTFDNFNHRSFFFGVQYLVNGVKTTLWYKDPKDSLCTIGFFQGTTPEHYYVQEVKF